MPSKSGWRALMDLPELDIAIFAFLLNFPWEILQNGLFLGMAAARHWDAVLMCTRATCGDVGIALAAFWGVAGLGSGRHWPRYPTTAQIVGFMAFGLAVTIGLELLATTVWHRWSYSAAMPVIPLLQVGLSPLLQWTILPPLIVWFMHGQLMGRSKGLGMHVCARTHRGSRWSHGKANS